MFISAFSLQTALSSGTQGTVHEEEVLLATPGRGARGVVYRMPLRFIMYLTKIFPGSINISDTSPVTLCLTRLLLAGDTRHL